MHVAGDSFLFSLQPTAHGYFGRGLNSRWIVVDRLVKPLILHAETNPESLSIYRTTRPAIHWIVPILAGIPFGMGVAQILQSLTTYLMDTYNIYFASAIAATVVLRSTCGAVFPLFSPAMFKALGDEWAMSVFACLSTICMPIPLLFWVRTELHRCYPQKFMMGNFNSRNTAGGSGKDRGLHTTNLIYLVPCQVRHSHRRWKKRYTKGT